jgi:VanZ family protein
VTFRTTLRQAWIWGPVAAYLALIFHLSAQSSVGWAPPYPDVVLHAVEYSVLGVLLARALNDGVSRTVPDRLLVLAWALCVIYAVSDEYHQTFVPGRTGDWRDALSDAAGTAAGLALLSLAQRHLWPRATVAVLPAHIIKSDARSAGSAAEERK